MHPQLQIAAFELCAESDWEIRKSENSFFHGHSSLGFWDFVLKAVGQKQSLFSRLLGYKNHIGVLFSAIRNGVSHISEVCSTSVVLNVLQTQFNNLRHSSPSFRGGRLGAFACIIFET